MRKKHKKYLMIGILALALIGFLYWGDFLPFGVITPHLADLTAIEYGEFGSTYRIKFSTWFVSTTTLKENGIFRFHAWFTGGGDEKVEIPLNVFKKYDWENAQIGVNEFYLRLKKDRKVWMDVPAQTQCKVIGFSTSDYSDHKRPHFHIECKVDVQAYADAYNTKIGFIRVRRGTFTIIVPLKQETTTTTQTQITVTETTQTTTSTTLTLPSTEPEPQPTINLSDFIIPIIGGISIVGIVLWVKRR
ncbi:MAG TPA: hypothetical protein ENF50_01700 [Archaeoglobus veneficus]|nr:hypothetical protein [Archaeoglobus veneficus]